MKRNTLIILVNLSVLLLVLIVVVSIQVAPIFTLSILAICTIAVLYILTEQWTTHDAVEFENRSENLFTYYYKRLYLLGSGLL